MNFSIRAPEVNCAPIAIRAGTKTSAKIDFTALNKIAIAVTTTTITRFFVNIILILPSEIAWSLRTQDKFRVLSRIFA